MSSPPPPVAGRAALWIFIAALSLRLVFALATPVESLAAGDQAEYVTIANNLLDGHGFAIAPGVPTPARAPGYPAFVAAVYAVSGRSPRAVLLAQAVLGAATCVLLLWLLRETVEDEKAARLGAILLAGYPILIYYSCRLLSESLFTFLMAASMLLLARHARRDRPLEAALSGLVLGLAALVRPGVVLMPWLTLGLLLLAGRRRALAWIGYAAAFYLTLLPWTMRNQELFGVRNLAARGPGFGIYATGRMTLGVSYEDAIKRYYELVELPEYQETSFVKGRSPLADLDNRLIREGKELILAHPFAYVRIVAKRLPRFWITSHSSVFGVDQSVSEYRSQGRWVPIGVRGLLLLLHTAILAAAAWGLWLLKDRRLAAALLAAVPLYMTIHIAFDMIPRYHIPAMPYLLGLAALGARRFALGSVLKSKSAR